MGSQGLAGFSQGDQGGFRRRVAIDPATDRREGDARHTVLHGQLEAGAVAGGQLLGFLCVPAVPYRAHGVDDPAGSQVEARSDAGFAGRTAAQACAVRPQAWARGAVYGAIHAAAAQKAGVGGIDDGIDGETGDVSLPEGNAVGRVHGSPPGQLHLYVMTPSSSARNLSCTSSRPRRHVVITVNTRMPNASGNQPPCSTFSRLAPKNAQSMMSSGTPSAITA